MKASKTELFEKTPVVRAVLALVVPTVISQIITVIYNMADTFFVGQVGDPNQVAAASLSLPLFLVTTGLANLFGIGGACLISAKPSASSPTSSTQRISMPLIRALMLKNKNISPSSCSYERGGGL